MKPLIFMTDIVEYVHNGDRFQDGVVYLEGDEVFRAEIVDWYEPEEELAHQFAMALRGLFQPSSKDIP